MTIKKLIINNEHGKLWFGDTLKCYKDWESPIVIVSDGPYGIDGYKGDAKKPSDLQKMYLPHIKAWTKKATSETTLWFWNTEIGWASVHPLLEKYGWVLNSPY